MKDPASPIHNVAVGRLKIEFVEHVMNEKIRYESMKSCMCKRKRD
jgi:hypothetical protein